VAFQGISFVSDTGLVVPFQFLTEPHSHLNTGLDVLQVYGLYGLAVWVFV
jgi:hypothetical protein